MTPPSSSSSGGSCSTSTMAILNNAVTVLNSADTNSTFCDHLLAELRTLPVDKARFLRYKLGRYVLDFMEKFHGNVETEMRPVQYVVLHETANIEAQNLQLENELGEPNIQSPTLQTGSESENKI